MLKIFLILVSTLFILAGKARAENSVVSISEAKLEIDFDFAKHLQVGQYNFIAADLAYQKRNRKGVDLFYLAGRDPIINQSTKESYPVIAMLEWDGKTSKVKQVLPSILPIAENLRATFADHPLEILAISIGKDNTLWLLDGLSKSLVSVNAKSGLILGRIFLKDLEAGREWNEARLLDLAIFPDTSIGILIEDLATNSNMILRYGLQLNQQIPRILELPDGVRLREIQALGADELAVVEQDQSSAFLTLSSVKFSPEASSPSKRVRLHPLIKNIKFPEHVNMLTATIYDRAFSMLSVAQVDSESLLLTIDLKFTDPLISWRTTEWVMLFIIATISIFFLIFTVMVVFKLKSVPQGAA